MSTESGHGDPVVSSLTIELYLLLILSYRYAEMHGNHASVEAQQIGHNNTQSRTFSMAPPASETNEIAGPRHASYFWRDQTCSPWTDNLFIDSCILFLFLDRHKTHSGCIMYHTLCYKKNDYSKSKFFIPLNAMIP